MARVLVTGGTGFIGRQTIAPLLAQGHDVHMTGRSDAAAPVGVTVHRVDLLDRNEVRNLAASVRADQLLHLAWSLEPGRYPSSFANHAWVAASMELLEHFAANGGVRAVLAGTCFEYEFGPPLLREGDPSKPDTLYGECKNELRNRVESWSSASGVACAWGRVFYLYGPHEDRRRLVASVVHALLSGRPAPCSEGLQVRDFLHVQDVAEGFVALLRSGVVGTVNIASGAPTTIRDVVEKVAEFAGNRELVQFGAFAPRPGDPPSVLGDTSKMRDLVGWLPRHNLHTGIADTVNWWRSELEQDVT